MSMIVDLIAPYVRARYLSWAHGKENCPVCQTASFPLDVLDANKTCEDHKGQRLFAAQGEPIAYYLCPHCGFCFAPKMAQWSLAEFESRIYNQDYAKVDPDYVDARPRANAQYLKNTFNNRRKTLQHLDYGGGSGLLAEVMAADGWQSKSYDPFVNRDTEVASLGKFDLITAFEVFEHVPEPRKLMAELAALLKPNGVVVFSTLVSDRAVAPYQRLSWWYAAPRNGHISLYSRQSLALLAKEYGFELHSQSDGTHFLWATVPSWAQHLAAGRSA